RSRRWEHPARRGREPCRPRRLSRHALLLLFDGNARTALPRVRRCLCRHGRRGLLFGQSQLQSPRAGNASKARRRHGCGVGGVGGVLAAGVQPEKIAFCGVGKTADEMAFALEEGIFAFNVESEPELRTLSETASSLGLNARIALRVNPDVDAKTHHKIATGKAENKFGITYEESLALYRLA